MSERYSDYCSEHLKTLQSIHPDCKILSASFLSQDILSVHLKSPKTVLV